jgi:hypothetical protein
MGMDSPAALDGGASAGVSAARASGTAKVVHLWFLGTCLLFRSKNVEERIGFGLGLTEIVALNVLQLGVRQGNE